MKSNELRVIATVDGISSTKLRKAKTKILWINDSLALCWRQSHQQFRIQNKLHEQRDVHQSRFSKLGHTKVPANEIFEPNASILLRLILFVQTFSIGMLDEKKVFVYKRREEINESPRGRMNELERKQNVYYIGMRSVLHLNTIAIASDPTREEERKSERTQAGRKQHTREHCLGLAQSQMLLLAAFALVMYLYSTRGTHRTRFDLSTCLYTNVYAECNSWSSSTRSYIDGHAYRVNACKIEAIVSCDSWIAPRIGRPAAVSQLVFFFSHRRT